MKHLLVTNDFPPKIGGIQSYLWELWHRLPPEDVVVLTTPYEGAADFDRQQAFRIERTRQRWLLPTESLVHRVRKLAKETGAEMVVLDPGLPLGLIGPRLGLPYAVVAHGAEMVIPARFFPTRLLLKRVVKNASLVIASGEYVATTAERMAGPHGPKVVSIPPGVDTEVFRPLTNDERLAMREQLHVPPDTPLVVGMSRLVPRKGFDRLIRAAARLQADHPDLLVLIGGSGREWGHLERLVRETQAPVRLLGRVRKEDLPGFYGCADVFVMPCHDRLFGLESEGFGIVFLEAAATGIPQVAGLSGGSAEAVVDGETGIVVDRKVSVPSIVTALAGLLDDPARRLRLGSSARQRAEGLSYDTLAIRLSNVLTQAVNGST